MLGKWRNKQKTENAGGTATQTVQRPVPKPGKISRRIAIASGKGGVGKSTVTHHLAMALAKQGHRVGVIDADIYGPSQSSLFGMKHKRLETTEEGLLKPLMVAGVEFISASLLFEKEGPILWRAPIANKVIKQFITQVAWSDLDFLLLDLPPGTGDIHITLAQQAALDGAIIVTTPQQMALNIAKKGLQMFQRVNVPILGIIENMSSYTCEACGHKQAIFKQAGADLMAEEFDTAVLAHLPLDPYMVECCDAGISMIERHPDAPISQRYLDIASQLGQLTLASDEGVLPSHVSFAKQGLTVTWLENEKQFSAHSLRCRCRCALCIDELSGKAILDPGMVNKDIALTKVSRVGRYGLKIDFSDGHHTGIYTFERLLNF